VIYRLLGGVPRAAPAAAAVASLMDFYSATAILRRLAVPCAIRIHYRQFVLSARKTAGQKQRASRAAENRKKLASKRA